MAEAALKLLSALGYTAIVFGFFANIDNALGVILGCIGVILGIYQIDKIRLENKHRRNEIKIQELDLQERQERQERKK